MDEFDEYHAFYIWPEGHEDGEPFGDDFYDRLAEGLRSVGLKWESV